MDGTHWVKRKQQATQSHDWSHYKVNWRSKGRITKENIILEKKGKKLS